MYLTTYHLQQSEVSHAHMVKVDIQGLPGVIFSRTFVIFENFGIISKLSRKEVYSQNAKYEPENETDKQNIHDGRYGAYESVHHHLKEADQKEDVTGGHDSPGSYHIRTSLMCRAVFLEGLSLLTYPTLHPWQVLLSVPGSLRRT